MAFAGAALMLLPTVLGFVHLRRVPGETELFTATREPVAATS